jgi:hypothetical protein
MAYRDIFHYPTLGFVFDSRQITGLPARHPITVSRIVIPYWPFLLALFLPELFLWMRISHAKEIRLISQTPPPPDPSLLVHDLPCVHCGYNMRTLRTTDRCPECGSLVADTAALHAELNRSRPGWLRCLASANVVLLLSRILLLSICFFAISARYGYMDETVVMFGAIAAAVLYVVGIYLLTRREHPYLPPPDRKAASRPRRLAIASLLCIAAAFCDETIWRSIGRPNGFRGRWSLDWHRPAIFLLVLGWLIYCLCTEVEYRFLAKLAGRLLDRFMTEHCKIAGLGAGVSSVLVLWVARSIFDMFSIPTSQSAFAATAAVIVLWLLFLVWTGFMNIYCAIRFTQQSWIAAERWRVSRA